MLSETIAKMHITELDVVLGLVIDVRGDYKEGENEQGLNEIENTPGSHF